MLWRFPSTLLLPFRTSTCNGASLPGLEVLVCGTPAQTGPGTAALPQPPQTPPNYTPSLGLWVSLLPLLPRFNSGLAQKYYCPISRRGTTGTVLADPQGLEGGAPSRIWTVRWSPGWSQNSFRQEGEEK